jgi:polyhydroxyalkanoate synthesis regulator phasin
MIAPIGPEVKLWMLDELEVTMCSLIKELETRIERLEHRVAGLERDRV